MEIKDYDNDNLVTMASEPAVAYQSISSSQTWTNHKDNMTVDEYFNKVYTILENLEAKSTTPPPCQYTEEEVIQRVLKATADVEARRDLMSQEEFETLVASW